jgi:hypothetical protein
MQLRNNAVPSPSFRAVAEIAQYAGRGRTVGHFATVRFPGGAVQVWALTPHTRAAARRRADDTIRMPADAGGAPAATA